MSSVEKISRVSKEAYFSYEEGIEGKAEFFNGEIFDMAGGSERHNRISMNLARFVGNLLEGKGCRTYNGDFRLAIEAANTFVRPDFWVICGPTEPFSMRDDTATNAVLVAEVQSESTTAFDRKGKWDRYRMLPTLREYVLIEQDNPQVDVYFRTQDGKWEFTSISDLREEVAFHSLGISIPMADIYRDVKFDEE
jgi:Uma2 family endonuclease